MSTEFNREIRSEILKLARDVLSEEEIVSADKLSDLLLGNEYDRRHAIQHLQELVGTGPKRPLYYLAYEITHLPEYTRHVVRYAGDYVDQIIKYCSYEKGKFFISYFRGLNKSLGVNLNKLKNVLPEELIKILIRFNEVIYVPSKHEWNVEEGRPHLFSSKEAVFVCFMSKKLSKQLVPFSPMAQVYNNNQTPEYYYDSSQK